MNQSAFRRLHRWLLPMLALLSFSSPVLGDIAGGLLDCAQIEIDSERLDCYDSLARQMPAVPELAPAEPAAACPAEPADEDSYLAKRWDLDESGIRGRFTLIPHRDNYIMPLTYNGSQDQPSDGAEYPVREVDNHEVKYQISFKSKLWQDVLGHKMDLWFAYTQQSYWQLYNFDESAPFRETNYEPELLLNFRPKMKLLGMDVRTFNTGFNHQSNGRSEPLSRSWNRLVANLGLEKGPFTLILKSWYRIPESRAEDDNRDIDAYLGYGEIQTYYRWHDHRLGLMLRNNLRSGDNRGALLLDWSFPVMEKVGLYIQYFNGYGENLLDYDQHANRIGIGFILSDWN
ncbi:phospholipase A [Trichloromonas sp.]|uniref:phospholipase A n=1 Tax=Trichloromonas sp. TaxID=3069249 RepID=UPI003D812C0A